MILPPRTEPVIHTTGSKSKTIQLVENLAPIQMLTPKKWVLASSYMISRQYNVLVNLEK